jgi:integrase
MSPEVKESLLLQKESMVQRGLYQPQGLVFVTERTHRAIYDEILGKRWRRSLERCGVKHRRLYSQRHSFISHSLAMGNSAADLAQVAGHSTETMLKVYAKPTGRMLMPCW